MENYNKLTVDMLKDIKIEGSILSKYEHEALNECVENILLNDLRYCTDFIKGLSE